MCYNRQESAQESARERQEEECSEEGICIRKAESRSGNHSKCACSRSRQAEEENNRAHSKRACSRSMREEEEKQGKLVSKNCQINEICTDFSTGPGMIYIKSCNNSSMTKRCALLSLIHLSIHLYIPLCLYLHLSIHLERGGGGREREIIIDR
jgi:hypothetical protein